MPWIKSRKPQDNNTRIFAKYDQTFYVKNGKVYRWGQYDYSPLGIYSTLSEDTRPALVRGLPGNIVQVAPGKYHALFLSADGRVFMTDIENRRPYQLNDLPSIKHVAAGAHHSVLCSVAGNVYTFGRNEKGQLGQGDRKFRGQPARVNLLSRIRYVAAGDYSTFMVTNDDEVLACGMNELCRLGLGHSRDVLRPVQVITLPVRSISSRSHHTVITTCDNKAYGFGAGMRGELCLLEHYKLFFPSKTYEPLMSTVPLHLTRFKDVAQVEVGDSHSVFHFRDGTVRTFGKNDFNQLGRLSTSQDSIASNVKQVAAGSDHTVMLLQDGSVVSVGKNNLGQLFSGDPEDPSADVRLAAGMSGALRP